MSKVHVVMGTTGEYSDHHEWPVRAFTDETKAANVVTKLTAAAAAFKYGYDWKAREAAKQAMAAQGDPNFDLDYTGTRYYLMEVELDTE